MGAIRVVLTDSTIADNQASSSGGGVWADQTITATNSTVTGNSATIAGGGLAVVNTSITLLHATVAGNTGPTGANIQLQPGSDTLIAFGSVVSLPVGGGANCDLAPGATTTSQGYNSTSDASCGLVGTGDVVTADPGLGSLAANGGPTATRLPAVGEPAPRCGPVCLGADPGGCRPARGRTTTGNCVRRRRRRGRGRGRDHHDLDRAGRLGRNRCRTVGGFRGGEIRATPVHRVTAREPGLGGTSPELEEPGDGRSENPPVP